MVISPFWPWLEKKLFKIKIGLYHWGYLRHTIYRQLNWPFRRYQLPESALEYLANQINYEKVDKISIILSTRNRLPALKKYALVSLLKINFDPQKYEVIIVDNNTDDLTYNYLRNANLPANYKILREKKSGLGRAYNRGIKAAHGDLITFLNDDCTVDVNWLSRMHNLHCQGRYLFAESPIYDEVMKKILNHRGFEEREKDFFNSGSFYRRETSDFISFNSEIVYGWEGEDLISQIFIFWPNFSYATDATPIKHYRAPSVYRPAGETEHNWLGRSWYGKTYGLWQIGKYCLKRNLLIHLPFFSCHFWLKEIIFLPYELILARGHILMILKTKFKIYHQLLKIKILTKNV